MILETARLWLREMDSHDKKDLVEMLQDPRVMYAYGHDFSDADVDEWLQRQIERYKKYGFGLWAVISKSSGEMVGQAGLTMQSYGDTEILEVGYLLKYRYWRHGYAREAAAGCRDYAFNSLGAEKVFSIIKTDNFSSIKVAEGIGMSLEDKFTTRYYAGDMEHYLYSVSKNRIQT